MKTRINSIDPTEEGEFFCSVTYIHENGDIFREYETYSKEELTSLVTRQEVVLICEYMQEEELSALIELLYTEEHEFNNIDGACDYIIGHGIATEEELQLITHINGYSIETLDSVVYARTGFNTVEQFYNEEQGV